MTGNNPRNPIVSAIITRPHIGMDGKKVLEPTQYHFEAPVSPCMPARTLSTDDLASLARAAAKRSRRARRGFKGDMA